MTSDSRSGFTLIEVMIVVIIIAALASMVLPQLMDLPDSMRDKIALGDMRSIYTALKVYRLENGKYPKELGALLVVPPTAKGRKEPYLEGEPNDPWEQPYIYKYPGSRSKYHPFDLYSAGADGSDDSGENDDIALWHQERR